MDKKKLPVAAAVGIAIAAVLVLVGLMVALLNFKPKQNQTPEQNNTSASGQTQTTPDTDPTPEKPDISVDPGVTNPSSFTPAEGSYTWPAAQVTDEQMAAVVATCGDKTLTNEQLGYYYWYGISTFRNTYGEYLNGFLDVTVPLDEQYYDNENQVTWQSYFLNQALSSFQYYAALGQAGEKAGFELPAEIENYLQVMPDSVAESVVNYGYPDVDTYLQSCFGPRATMDGYLEFTRAYLYGSSYASSLQSGLSFTEAEVEAYFDEHAASFADSGVTKDGTRLVNVRHILLMPEDAASDADWADAKEKAEDIYATWKNKGTEESFAQLAANYSQDPGSAANGGLYNNVYPGQMVQNFNDWCFDASRKEGDTTIVETEYGYHIMYFSGYGDEYWRFVAYNSLLTETYAAMEEELLGQYELVSEDDQIVLLDPVGMYA